MPRDNAIIYITVLKSMINKYLYLCEVSILIRGLILFIKVIKKQSIFTYQLMIVYAHEHLMTHLHRIYIMLCFHFFFFFFYCSCMYV